MDDEQAKTLLRALTATEKNRLNDVNRMLRAIDTVREGLADDRNRLFARARIRTRLSLEAKHKKD